MNAVDSNILLYSVDIHEPAKLSRAQELIEKLSDEQTILPWQELCEAANGLRRWANKGRISASAAEGYIELFSELYPVEMPTELQIFREATLLFRKVKLSHWDSLLIAACAVAGVSTLYSEDSQSGEIISGVRIVNPFV